MKLPEIMFRAVESSADAVAKPGLVAGKVISEQGQQVAAGLKAYSEELHKTQRMRADATLSSDLADVSASLEKPYMTKREVMAATSETGLPSEVLAMLDGKSDDDPVPTWMVGEHIFEARAAKAKERAAKEVGWSQSKQNAFSQFADREVLARRTQLSGKYVREQHDYQTASQLVSIDAMTRNAQAPVDYEAAREAIRSSRIFDGAQKEKLLAGVGEKEDTAPVYRALQTGTVLDLSNEKAALADAKRKTNLTPEQRTSFTQAIDARLAHYERSMRHPSPEDVRKANTERLLEQFAVWEADLEVRRKSDPAGVAREMTRPDALGKLQKMFLPDLSTPMEGGTRERMLGKMLEYTGAKKYAPAKGPKVKTDPIIHLKLNLLADQDPDAFKRGILDLGPGLEKVTLYDLKKRGLLSDAHYFAFSSLIRTLAHAKNAKDAPTYKTQQEDFQVAKDVAATYQMDPKSKSPDEQGRVGHLTGVVLGAIERATPAGKRLTREEKFAVAKTAAAASMQPGSERSWWFDSKARIPAQEAGLDPYAGAAVQRSMDARHIPRASQPRFYATMAESYKATEAVVEEVARLTPRVGTVKADEVVALSDVLANPAVVAKLDADVMRYLTRTVGEASASAWAGAPEAEKTPNRALLWLLSRKRK